VTIAYFKDVCLDAAEPARLGSFWATVLGLGWEAHDDGDGVLTGPTPQHTIWVNKVPEPKTVKNRMHICLRPTDRTRDEEIDRIVGLGATLVDDLRDGDRGWVVLGDPEGNEFCVLTPYRPSAPADGGAG
jgi:predicted enzyme related to lactoylglutathione lyase